MTTRRFYVWGINTITGNRAGVSIDAEDEARARDAYTRDHPPYFKILYVDGPRGKAIGAPLLRNDAPHRPNQGG